MGIIALVTELEVNSTPFLWIALVLEMSCNDNKREEDYNDGGRKLVASE